MIITIVHTIPVRASILQCVLSTDVSFQGRMRRRRRSRRRCNSVGAT